MTIDYEEKSGELAMLWKGDVEFEFLQYSKHHFHGVVSFRPKGQKWFHMRVYGYLEVSQRPKFCSLIKSFKPREHIPWLILGEFIEILKLSEKWGEWYRSEK